MKQTLITLCIVGLIIFIACNAPEQETVDTPVVTPVEEVVPEIEALPEETFETPDVLPEPEEPDTTNA